MKPATPNVDHHERFEHADCRHDPEEQIARA
jgi:hypothetical protein